MRYYIDSQHYTWHIAENHIPFRKNPCMGKMRMLSSHSEKDQLRSYP